MAQAMLSAALAIVFSRRKPRLDFSMSARPNTEIIDRQDGAGYTALVLAGKRPGVDPVAALQGETYKAKVMVGGVPMLTRVIAALGKSQNIGHTVVIAGETLGDIHDIKGLAAAAGGMNLSVVPARDSISDSVLAAISSRPAGENFLITTSDHPLLTGAMIDDFLGAAAKKGISIAFVTRQVIESAHPGMRRTYLPFRGAKVSGANLFAVSGTDALPVIKLFQKIEANRKSPIKMAAIFGPLNLAGFVLRVFTLEQAFGRLSRVLDCALQPVLLRHANAAVDVDKPADMETVEALLAAGSPAPRQKQSNASLET